MISAILRRWRALRPRSRAVSILLAMTTLLVGVGFGLADRWRGDSWPAKAIFQTSECALPLGFSPDGRTFVTSGRGITSWDVASGQEGATLALTSGGNPEVWASSPDGKTFAAAIRAYPGPLSIDLFDTATGRTRASQKTPRGTIMHLAFADDGRTLRAFLGDDPQFKEGSGWNASFGGDLNEVVTYDATTGRETSSRPLTAPTRRAATAISPDGRVLAINDRQANAVQLWDLDADRTLGSLDNPATVGAVNGAGLGFSDDGRTLAIGRIDGSIELWDIPGRQLLTTLRGHTNDFTFTSLRLSPDGRTLAVTGNRWGLKSPLTRIQEEIRRVLGLRPRYDEEILVLNVATGRRLARAADSTRPFYSPDGKTLATQEPNGSTRLRDTPEP